MFHKRVVQQVSPDYTFQPEAQQILCYALYCLYVCVYQLINLFHFHTSHCCHHLHPHVHLHSNVLSCLSMDAEDGQRVGTILPYMQTRHYKLSHSLYVVLSEAWVTIRPFSFSITSMSTTRDRLCASICCKTMLMFLTCMFVKVSISKLPSGFFHSFQTSHCPPQ